MLYSYVLHFWCHIYMREEQPGFRKKNAMLPECFQSSWFAHAVSGVYHKIVSPVWWCLPSIHHSSSFVPPSPSWTQRFEKISHDQPIFPGAGSSGVQFLGGDLAGPLAIDDTAFTLIFKAKLGALFPVVILFMLAFSNTAAKVLPSVLRSSSLNPHWVGKDWEIKQGRAPNGQVPTLAKLGSKLLVWKGTCFEQLRFAVLLQLHVLQSKEARGSHTQTLTQGVGTSSPKRNIKCCTIQTTLTLLAGKRSCKS